jgi:hypothetical protein
MAALHLLPLTANGGPPQPNFSQAIAGDTCPSGLNNP